MRRFRWIQATGILVAALAMGSVYLFGVRFLAAAIGVSIIALSPCVPWRRLP